MGAQVGPGEVVAAASTAVEALASVARSSSVAGERGSRAEWAAALEQLQRVADVAAAAQDAVLVALAAIEEGWAEDGTVQETHRAPGHVALDAAAVVSGVLNVSAVHAERRVRSAVRLAADGPVGSASATGLAGLHAAMAAGRVDGYRAAVVADELELAPAQVAASVVGALESFLGAEDATALRRRCRRLLARVCPDLLRQRAVRARAESRLERWASEPGVDCWHGTFPSEEAARAWAAVDALAQRYVAAGTCPEIGRARAKALTDLVEGSATIETVLTLVVPHDAAPGEGGPVVPGVARPASRSQDPPPRSQDPPPRSQDPPPRSQDPPPRGPVDPAVGDPMASAPREVGADGGSAHDLVEVAGVRAGEPLLVARGWLQEAVAATRVAGQHRTGRVRVVAGDPATGALVDPAGVLGGDGYRPRAELVALVRARDGRCRFPGCQVAARFCDIDHARAWPAGRTSAQNLVCLCRRHHRVKQRPRWRLALAPDGTATWTDPTGRTRTTVPVDTLHPLVLRAADDELHAGELPPGVGTGERSGGAGTGERLRGAGTGERLRGAGTGERLRGAGTGERLRGAGTGERLRGAGAGHPPATPAGPRLLVPDGPHSSLEHRLEHHLPGHWRHLGRRAEVSRRLPGRWLHDGQDHRAVTPRRAHRRRVPDREEPPPF